MPSLGSTNVDISEISIFYSRVSLSLRRRSSSASRSFENRCVSDCGRAKRFSRMTGEERYKFNNVVCVMAAKAALCELFIIQVN